MHWFRSKALAARWQEELVLLLEEMRRSVRFFLRWRNMWNDRARARERQDELGAAAYARRSVCDCPLRSATQLAYRRQAHRYTRLIALCEERFTGLTL